MNQEEILRTKDTTTKVIINYNKDPFTSDDAQQVLYAISGRNSENRMKFTNETGFKELFGKVLVGVLMNNKGQLVLYFEESNVQQQAEAMKSLIEETKKIDKEGYNNYQQQGGIDNTRDYYRMTKKDERLKPLEVESKEKLMERYKDRYSEKEIDMMVNKASIINAVDRFTGSV